MTTGSYGRGLLWDEMADEGWVPPGGERSREQATPLAPPGHAVGGTVAGAPAPGQPWPPAPPPPARGAGGRVVLGLLAIVALAAAGVGLAFVLPGEHEGNALTEAPPAAAGDVELVPFQDPRGNYTLSVPEDWTSVSLEGDLAEIAREAFPDDPRRAEALEQFYTAASRAVVFASIDSDAIGTSRFATNVNVVRLPGGDVDQAMAAERRALRRFGGEVTDEGRFTTAAGEAVRMEYILGDGPGGTELGGIQYGVPAGGAAWILTFTSDDLPADEPLADAVAATFAPGG